MPKASKCFAILPSIHFRRRRQYIGRYDVFDITGRRPWWRGDGGREGMKAEAYAVPALLLAAKMAHSCRSPIYHGDARRRHISEIFVTEKGRMMAARWRLH